MLIIGFYYILITLGFQFTSQVVKVKNLPANAEDIREWGSVPGFRRSPEGGYGSGSHFSVLSWRIPWTVEPAGLQSIGSQRVRPD